MQKSLGIAWWKLGNKMRRCKLIKIRAVKLCMWDWIQIYLAIFYVLLYTVSIVVCHVFNYFFFLILKVSYFTREVKTIHDQLVVFTSYCVYGLAGCHSCQVGPLNLLSCFYGFTNYASFSSHFSYCWTSSTIGPFVKNKHR